MNTDLYTVNAFASGAISLAFAFIGVSFYRFWRRSKIRLFHRFAIAFYLLAIERVVLVLTRPDEEAAPYLYFIRLAAFTLIIIGIVQHNRTENT